MKRKSSVKDFNKSPKRQKLDTYLGRAVTKKDIFAGKECNSKQCACAGLDRNFEIDSDLIKTIVVSNPIQEYKVTSESLRGVYTRPFQNHELARPVFDKVLNLNVWAQYWVGSRSLFVFPKNFLEAEKKHSIPLGGWCIGSARSLCPPKQSKLSNSHVDCVLKWTLFPEAQKKWTLVVGQVPKTGPDQKMSLIAFFPLGGWLQLAALAWELPGATMPETVVTVSEAYVLNSR